jgi:hypothetical protein
MGRCKHGTSLNYDDSAFIAVFGIGGQKDEPSEQMESTWSPTGQNPIRPYKATVHKFTQQEFGYFGVG